MPSKPLQIIPANGWQAVYYDNEENTFVYSDLVCFALIEHDDNDREVVGMTHCPETYIYECNEDKNFIGYLNRNVSNKEIKDQINILLGITQTKYKLSTTINTGLET